MMLLVHLALSIRDLSLLYWMRPSKIVCCLYFTVILILSSLLSQPMVLAAGIPDQRFGVVEAYEAPAAASALGAGWERVTFRWNEIQPNGPEEWNVVPISDAQLAAEIAQGRQVVGLLLNTPNWATDWERGPGVPRGLYLPIEDPANTWAVFVRSIVGRYAGKIDHWIIWNEPDIPNTQHMSWGGSIQDFIQLLKVAYTVAKQTNPNAVIHMAAVTHWWNEHWFGQFLEELVTDPQAAANNYYFDVATLHIYFQSETVYDLTIHYYQLMRNRGIYKPIWIAETNAAPSQDPAWPVPNAQFNISLEEQAFFIIQAFSLAIAAGAERIAVFKMIDTETDRAANPEPFGLVRMDGSRRPAFRAYQTATTYLAGFRRGRWERRDQISVVTIDRGAQTTTVVWARVPERQTAMIPARTTRALLVDVWGSTRTIYPERGYYFVELAGANCTQGCRIGGPPILLVENAPFDAGTFPPPASATPSVMQSALDTPMSDTSTVARPTQPATTLPTPTRTPTSTPTRTPTPTSTRTPTNTPPPSRTATVTPVLAGSPSLIPAVPTPSPSTTTTSNTDNWLLAGALAVVAGGAAGFTLYRVFKRTSKTRSARIHPNQ